MAIYHLVMTIRVGIYPKKNFKKFDHVQLLWNDPYALSQVFLRSLSALLVYFEGQTDLKIHYLVKCMKSQKSQLLENISFEEKMTFFE